jgi:hypothetical protein
MRKSFVWKRSRISVLKVEAVPQSYIPQVQAFTDALMFRMAVQERSYLSGHITLCLNVSVTSSVRNVSLLPDSDKPVLTAYQ